MRAGCGGCRDGAQAQTRVREEGAGRVSIRGPQVWKGPAARGQSRTQALSTLPPGRRARLPACPSRSPKSALTLLHPALQRCSRHTHTHVCTIAAHLRGFRIPLSPSPDQRIKSLPRRLLPDQGSRAARTHLQQGQRERQPRPLAPVRGRPAVPTAGGTPAPPGWCWGTCWRLLTRPQSKTGAGTHSLCRRPLWTGASPGRPSLPQRRLGRGSARSGHGVRAKPAGATAWHHGGLETSLR